MSELLKFVAAFGDFTKRPEYDHYLGVREAVIEMGGSIMQIDCWRGYYDKALDVIPTIEPSLALYLIRDPMDCAKIRDAVRRYWSCPIVFWYPDVALGIAGMQYDGWADNAADMMFVTNMDEVDKYEDLLKIPVRYLPQAVRRKRTFPDRCESIVDGDAIFAGQMSESYVHASRTSLLRQLANTTDISFVPEDGSYDPKSFPAMRRAYRNPRFTPCLNMSSVKRNGYVSNRFWIILQEGGFMISCDEPGFGMEDKVHFLKCTDLEELPDMIKTWSGDEMFETREHMAMRAHEHAQKNHRYAHRIMEMVNNVQKEVIKC